MRLICIGRRGATTVSSSPSPVRRPWTVFTVRFRLSCRCSRPPRGVAPSSSPGTTGPCLFRLGRSRPEGSDGATGDMTAPAHRPTVLLGRRLALLLRLADMLGERLVASLAGTNGIQGELNIGLLRPAPRPSPPAAVAARPASGANLTDGPDRSTGAMRRRHRRTFCLRARPFPESPALCCRQRRPEQGSPRGESPRSN